MNAGGGGVEVRGLVGCFFGTDTLASIDETTEIHPDDRAVVYG